MKYFPIGTIFDAKISSRFYACKSIIHSHKAISQGAKWRIRVGRKSGFMMIYGYLVITMVKFFPLILNFQKMLRLNPSLILK